MTTATFFEKFDLFIDAPNAVAKMRELVLQLAVQGKLVERKVNDGNAGQLLAAISSERDTRAAKLRTPNEPVSADGNEHAFPIPSNWAWTQLGNIALQIQYGYTASADPSATEIRMLRITDIQNNRVDWPSVPGCQIEPHEAEKYLLSPNDILIARTGGTIGKSFIVPDAPVKSVFASYLIRVTPPHSMAARYLKTFLESPLYWSQLRKMSAGTGQPNVNGQALGRLEIPLPPLAEQKRIVAKVDELMALCDRLEAQQQEREEQASKLARASLARFADAPSPATLSFLFHPSYAIPPADLRKSILTLAVQGKLVPQDPNDESAEEILAGTAGDVAKAVRAKRMRNSRSIPEYQDEFPFGLAAGWAWAPLGTLTAAEDGAMCDGPFGSKLKTEHYIPTKGYAVLRLGNIGVGYFIHGKEGHISREHFESLPSNHTAPGDLLVAGLADPLVRCCEVPPDIGPAVNKSDCFRVRLSKRMDRSYVRQYLNSPIAKAFAAEENHGMTRERINLANAKALPVSVPPLAEQCRIVAKVEQLMALVDALETQLAAARATAANHLSALVAELTTHA